MARGRQNVDQAIAEVQRRLAAGPIRQPEERGDTLGADGDEGRGRMVGELVICRAVVSVAVRVSDREGRDSTAPINELVDGLTEREALRVGGRARIQEERGFGAEEQVDERSLEVDALALTKHERVVIEGDHLDRRVGRLGAVGSAVDPADGGKVEHHGRFTHLSLITVDAYSGMGRGRSSDRMQRQ